MIQGSNLGEGEDTNITINMLAFVYPILFFSYHESFLNLVSWLFFSGLPIWLREIPNITFRSDNQPFMVVSPTHAHISIS